MATEVIAANIAVHTLMADTYNHDEPHFRPENRRKVRSKLEDLRGRVGGGRLLDLGCGTGFVIDLARDLFAEIHGVDVTRAMLDKVDVSSGNVTLHECSAEHLPFPDGRFDLVTSYAFIHHVERYDLILREACRVLRPGGLMFVALEPNRRCWEAIKKFQQHIEGYTVVGLEAVSDILAREMASVLDTDERVNRQFGIDPQVFNKAEYTKAILGGIDPDEFVGDAKAAGFRECQVIPEWYLGQGNVMHGQSFDDAAVVEAYLRRVYPLSAHLFKYLEFVLAR